MKTYVCDACGETVRQAIRIDTDLEYIGSNIATWSDDGIAGDYCQDCANKIRQFMYDLKGEGDSFNAKVLRAEMNRES